MSDLPRELVITPELIERMKSWDRAQNSPRMKKIKKICARKTKQYNKLIKEMGTISKTANLKMQKALQILEDLSGKHARAQYAGDWLEDTTKYYNAHNDLTPRQDQILQDRIKFLRDMSFRAGDVYEYKW